MGELWLPSWWPAEAKKKKKKRVGLIVKDVQWVHTVEFLCYQIVGRVILMNAHLVIGRLAGESCMRCVLVCVGLYGCVWAWDMY